MKVLPESAIEILNKVKSPSMEDLLEQYLYTGYNDYYLDSHCTNQVDVEGLEEFCKMIYIDWRNSLVNGDKSKFTAHELAVAQALEMYDKFNPATIDAKKKSKTPYYNFFYKGYDKYFKGTGTRAVLLQDGSSIMPDEDYIPDGFMHVFGYGITRKQREPIEGRLYLNLQGKNIAKFATEAYKKCKEAGLPFYFKFSSNDNRNDPFLFYVSYQNMAKYIDIIEEIKTEKPDLLEGTELVSRNMGTINGYIGYGDEPSAKNESYNSTRRMAFSEIKKTLTRSRKQMFSSKNSSIFSTVPKPMTYEEYMDFLLDDFIAKNLVKTVKTKQSLSFSVDFKNIAKTQIKRFILEGKPLEDIQQRFTDVDFDLPLSKLDLQKEITKIGGKVSTITEARGVLAKFAFFSSTKPNEDEKKLNRIVKEQLVNACKQDLQNQNLKDTAKVLLDKLDKNIEELDGIGKAIVLIASAGFMENGRILVHTKKHTLCYDEILPEVYKGVLGEDAYNDAVNQSLEKYNISKENLCFNKDTSEALKERTKA